MWAKSGRYTGTTDIKLTPEGIAQVSSMAARVVGAGKLLDPSRLAHMFISPRRRAKETFELLLLSPSSSPAGLEGDVTHTNDIAEWDYGDYEGLKEGEIRKLRKERGLDREREWVIWRDGCEGGEYVVLNFHPFPSELIDEPLLIPSCYLRTHQSIGLCSKSASV